ncbi:MAG TPA: oligosaccharide flippase family protein [Chthonomonadales bacterium]|nr:oligosaccharide flippase family protein [Chthonomonadales bacterium]
MNRRRIILGGIVWMMGGQLLSWSLRLVEAAVVPRILGAHGVGVVGYVGTLFAVIGLLTMFGGPEQIIRSVAADCQRGAVIATHMLVARLLLLPPILAIVYFGSRWAFRSNPSVLILIPIGLIVAFLQPIGEVLLAWRQAHNQFGVAARTQMAAQSASLPTSIALVATGFGTRGAAWGAAVYQIVLVAAVWIQKNNPIRFAAITLNGFRMMFSECKPYLRYNLFLWLYGSSTSVLFISLLGSYTAIGWYLLAGKLLGVIFVIPMTTLQAVTPTLTDAYVRARHEFESLAPRFVNLIMALSVLFGAVLFLRADSLLRVMHYPRSLYPAAILIRVMGLGLWMRWTGVCYGSLLVITGNADLRAKAATVATPYNLLSTPLYVLLCGRFLHNAALGAVIATETTEILIVALYIRHLHRPEMVRRNLAVTARALAAVVAPVILLKLAPTPNLVAFIAVSALAALAYIPAAMLTGALPREAMTMLQNAARSRAVVEA